MTLAASSKLQDLNTKSLLWLFLFWSPVTPAVACLLSATYEMERTDAGCHKGNVIAIAQRAATWNTKSRPWTLFGCEPAASAGSEVGQLCGDRDCRRHTRLVLLCSRCTAACLDVTLPLRTAESCSNPDECWQCCISIRNVTKITRAKDAADMALKW